MLALLGGSTFRLVGKSTRRGPEWHGPCPVCGGRDRFHIWPEQDGGSFWCRQCGKGGDLIEYYRWSEGLSYREACARAGVAARVYSPLSAPVSRPGNSRPSRFAPTAPASAVAVWSAHAAKFAAWAHEQLLTSPDPLQWLARRGISAAMIGKYRLGWCPRDTYRARESWGLPVLLRRDGKPRLLWLPQGLVIPLLQGGTVCRLRIRRPHPGDGPRYYVVPGSGSELLVSSPNRGAYVVVESELDAITIDAAAGDLVGVVALSTSSAKPTPAVHDHLSRSVHLSISLDADPVRKNPRTGKVECPGAQAAAWWLGQYRQAVRVPPVGGKDPGDMAAAGLDIRSWVLAGLPPRFHLLADPQAALKKTGRSTVGNTIPGKAAVAPAVASVAAPDPEPSPEPSGPSGGLPAALSTAQPGRHYVLRLTCDQEVHVTDDQLLYEDLQRRGHVVFSENELRRLSTALTGLNEADRAAAIHAVLAVKTTMPGAYIRRGAAPGSRRKEQP
ncbi:MAG: primase-helicase zinc-binding domain-containing protein [Desulfobulbus sp.]|jgi:DNA primase